MLKLWPHQQLLVDYVKERPYALLYAGMSTGKTLVALELCKETNGNCLIIAPKSALDVYAEDVDKLYGGDYPKSLVVLNRGTSKSKAEQLKSISNSIVTVNYETARLLPLEAYQWDYVVCDEAHKLGTHNSKQTIDLTRKLARNVGYRAALTGTPFNDGYEKLYSIVRWLDPVIPDNPRAHPVSRVFNRYIDFLYHYCNTYELDRGVKVITGYKNIDRLTAKIKPFTYFLRTQDVIDLPELVTHVYRVKLDNPLAQAYRQYARDNVITIDSDTAFTRHKLAKVMRAQQLATTGIMHSDDGQVYELGGIKPRIDMFSDIMSYLTDKPIVVFTKFKRDVELLTSAIGEPCAYLTGDKNTLDDWKRGDYRVLIANMTSGGVGTRLERAAHVIHWSIGYSATDYEQSIARLRRSGQVSDTVYQYVILSDDTIDVDIWQVLDSKDKDKLRLDDRLAI